MSISETSPARERAGAVSYKVGTTSARLMSPRTLARESARSYTSRRHDSGEVSPRTVPRDVVRAEQGDHRSGWCVVQGHRPMDHAQTQVDEMELCQPTRRLEFRVVEEQFPKERPNDHGHDSRHDSSRSHLVNGYRPRRNGMSLSSGAGADEADIALAHRLAAAFHVPPLLSLVDGSMTIAEARAAAALWRMRLEDQRLSDGEPRPRKRRWSSLSGLME
jgi:hypothetical protein